MYDITDFSKTLSAKIFNAINFNGLLDSAQRIIELEFLEDHMVKASTTSILKYNFLHKDQRDI